MTAFAAILSDGPPIDERDSSLVLAALAPFHASGSPDLPRSESLTLAVGACTILTARTTSPTMDFVLDRTSGIAAAGQVLLEDRPSLARLLDVPDAVTSDMAVVVAAYWKWGSAFTERLNGEYAFVLWDGRSRTLTAARDGLGIRLLYAAQGRGRIVVSNVLAAAAADPHIPRDIDEHACTAFLANGEPGENRTAYSAVNAVPPGHTLRIPAGRAAHLGRHWWFPQADGPAPRPRDIVDGYRSVLERATADRLRVPRAALLLSGGLDSATLAAAARAAAPAVSIGAFTAVYERVPGSSELPLSSAVGRALGIPVTAVVSDRFEALDALRDRPAGPHLLDEPTLADWRALLQTAAGYSSVGVCGEDGDALFLPPELPQLCRQMTASAILASGIRSAVRETRVPYVGLRLRERLFAWNTLRPAVAGWLTPAALTVLSDAGSGGCLGLRPVPLPPHPARPRMQARLCAGIPHHLASLIAPDVTGAAMELRFPLLDTRVIRFVVSTPPLPWCQNKRLARDAYRGRLPDAIVDRRKTGIAGLHELLVRSWQDHHSQVPEVSDMVRRWIDPAAWRRALSSNDPRRVAAAWRVLQLEACLAGSHGLPRSMQSVCTA